MEELDIHQSLGNLGIDSLMAVELRNHVQASLGIVIPVAQLLQDPSISQLAQGICRRIEGAHWLLRRQIPSRTSCRTMAFKSNTATSGISTLTPSPDC